MGTTCTRKSLEHAGMVRDFLIAAALQQLYKIRYYIEHAGIHPDMTLDGKPTALCYAALKPNLPLIGYYLSRGADVNHADAMGMTPLHYAAMGGCVACLARLLAQGARVNHVDRSGEIPLRRARNTQCAALLKCYDAGSHRSQVQVPRFH